MTSPAGNFYRSLIGPLFVPTFLTAMLLGIADPVLPLYLQESGASYAVVGIVISALEIGRLIAALPSSGVLTRFTMRRTMLAGLGILTAALLVMAMVSTLAVVFAAWLLAGIGLTLYELARHQFIAVHIANQTRGRAVALIGGVFRLAGVIGPIVGGWVAQTAGYRAPFWVMAGLAVVTAVIVLRYMPPQLRPTQPFSLSAYGKELAETFRENRQVLLVAGSGQLMMQLVRRTRSVIVPLYAANIIGLDVASVGVVISIGAALDTVLFPVAGWLIDRFGRKMAIIPSLLLQASGLLLMPLAATFAGLVSVVCLIGFGNGISAGTMLTLGADLAPQERRTPFLGLWRISNSLGFALGPNIVGTVAALLTLPLASMAAGVIGLFAAVLFYRFVPETLERPSQTVTFPAKPG